MTNNQERTDWVLDDNGFEVRTPQLLRPWYNYISNGEYGLKISHLGDAYSTTLEQPRIAVSNYDFFHPSKGRFVFVRDGDTIWAPSSWPCKTPLDSYTCRHESGATTFTGKKNNIQISNTVFVPESGTAEMWIVSASNNDTKKRTIDIFPEMEFLLYNSFSVDPVYYSWYSDTRVDEKGAILFERRLGESVTGFFAPLEKPNGFETSLRRFLGNSDISRPEAVVSGKLSNAMSGGDAYIGAFHYHVELEPGETKKLAFFAGAGKDTLENLRKEYPDTESVCAALEKIKISWKKKLDRDFFDSVPEGTFKNWLKTFFGYQLYQQSLGMVRGTFRGFRDVAQDIMGIVPYDAPAARSLLLDLATRMLPSGQCLRQWNTEGGANDERDFRDLPFWLIIALDAYERQTGDSSIYSEKAGWTEKEQITPAVTLWEHAIQGIQYAMHYGDHGLILMGAGDWNDALSGPGAQGGTTFLNQIAYFSLTLVNRISRQHGLRHTLDISGEQERLYNGVMRYWNGKWFARAVTDKGEIVGDENDNSGTGNSGHTGGRIFLLPQIWFTISGMAERNKEAEVCAKTAIDTALEKLESPAGLLKCYPGYSEFTAKAGNLSALTPGMAENFAVYNHAAAFSLYALLKAGRTEDARRILHTIVPFTHDWKKTKAEPYVTVNFYNGGYYPEKTGEGGVPWLTGTINWLSLAFFEFGLPF